MLVLIDTTLQVPSWSKALLQQRVGYLHGVSEMVTSAMKTTRLNAYFAILDKIN